jgi:tetratricopeptide (TPR) repeat protein
MKTLITLCLMLLSCSVYSGSGSSDKKTAEELFARKQYAEALPIFLEILQSDSLNINALYHAGCCYFYSRSQQFKALPYLEKAITLNESAEGGLIAPLAYKLVADLYHLQYRFDQAILNYEKFRGLLDSANVSDIKEMEEAGWKIDMCKVGKALDGLSKPPAALKKGVAQKPSVNPIKPGLYSSALSLDQSKMVFTFSRGNKTNTSADDSKYYEPLVIRLFPDTSYKDLSKVKFEKKNKNEATIATSVDGQIVLNYRDDKGTANLYITCLNGNEWTVPEKLNRPVNTAGWEENEYISADGSVLYFTSKREGGYGGKDIYVCHKTENGEWGKAENLGPVINTSFDEEAPFIHPDGVTLYFSSNGRQSPGQLDIFTSTFSGTNWSNPVNVGFPRDTTHDEEKVLPLVKESMPQKKTRKTKKVKAETKDENKSRDNYLISFNNLNGAPLTLLKGTIHSGDEQIAGAVKIMIRNNFDSRLNAVYYTDSLSRKYALILPPGKNNNIGYYKPGYLIFSENIDLGIKHDLYEKRTPLELVSIAKDNKTILNNIFYDPDKTGLNAQSATALNDLLGFLKENPSVAVEFNISIAARDNIKQYSRLAQSRSEAIVSYLKEKGIPKERLIAYGTATRKKRLMNREPVQTLELKVLSELPDKSLLTTQ